MSEVKEQKVEVGTFACISCGADLKYKPGTTHLSCDYCGAENDIPELETSIDEIDFHTFLLQQKNNENTITEHFVKCDTCGASSTIEPHVSSTLCPYCSSPLVGEHAHDETIIQPKSLLPFKLDKKAAKESFKKWVNKLWWAPNKLKKAVLNFDHFKGVYIPYWTYDTDTSTSYIGQRGVYYYETERYTTTEDGKTVTKTRQVRKTRWYPASGNVSKLFDDILVAASNSVEKKYIYKLEPWDLENLTPFEKSYLSGFTTEKYQIDLEQGFEIAKDIAEPQIRNLIERDIGGDEQRILNMHTRYNDITFKHILLPVYVSAYKFKDKLYQFVVNARTGEVQGQRPYSWVKITFAILTAIAVIGGLVYYFQNK